MQKVTCAVLAGALALGAVHSASAAPIAPLDSTAFQYRWDFNGGTTQENYDRYDTATGAEAPTGDGTNEWTPVPAPVSGVVSTTGAFVNTFWNTSPAAAAEINTTTGYTVEWHLKMTTTTRLLVETTLPGTTAAATGQINATDPNTLDIFFDLGSTAGGVRASVPADEFFTVRIAGTPDATKPGGLAYTLYVNDALAADDLNAERTTILSRRFFAGDTGSATAGTLEMDYAAFTPGAFAPVGIPEPAALSLLGLGALGLLFRRR